ncbi:endoplasmic reticulum receptor [Bacillus spizizenii TU-B-10]|uniref:Endoplasmic reticulum receptor n=1 Tax=Bacillus spizizenii (strain DSM 15029 / JCM 12233 / NBRC 101239 / NRRL B-23049 / TU-B-10) TaxID=1052585 RepID=G4NRL4_BACS4|nr:endoplasmic reticulum receptor [Bacillus spizizenii TU-B-10]APH67870.1 endoplasmic reticulum receptor [Bacillus subtilis]
MFIVPLFQNIIEEVFVMQFVPAFDKDKPALSKKAGQITKATAHHGR